MPVYDYDCAACGGRIEVVHGVNAPGPAHCPNCGGGPLKKAISAPAVHFKGSGWAKKERHATVAPGSSKANDSPGVADGEGKDGGGASESTPDKAGEGGKGSDERPGTDERAGAEDRPRVHGRKAAAKPAGAGTATRTD